MIFLLIIMILLLFIFTFIIRINTKSCINDLITKYSIYSVFNINDVKIYTLKCYGMMSTIDLYINHRYNWKKNKCIASSNYTIRDLKQKKELYPFIRILRDEYVRDHTSYVVSIKNVNMSIVHNINYQIHELTCNKIFVDEAEKYINAYVPQYSYSHIIILFLR